MGRSPSVVKYSPEQQARIDGLLRRYQYGCLDLILAELEPEGIFLSRSALGRYSQNLRATDDLVAASTEQTMVIVVDLRTGTATQLRTSATPEIVTCAIGALAQKSVDNDQRKSVAAPL
jgi:hypothetical protein